MGGHRRGRRRHPPADGLFVAPKPKPDQVPELTGAHLLPRPRGRVRGLPDRHRARQHASGIARSTCTTRPRRAGRSAIGGRVLRDPRPGPARASRESSGRSTWPEVRRLRQGGEDRPEANTILTGGVRVATGSAGIAGQFALGFAFVLISLNAMRAGLLTASWASWILVGVFPVLLSLLASTLSGVGGPAPIVQFFWLGAWPTCSPAAGPTGCRRRGRPARRSCGRRARRCASSARPN